MKPFLLLIPILTLLNGCSLLSGDDNLSEVYIRLSNVSPYSYQDIRVSTTGDEVNFGDLETGQFTDYRIFEKAYRYAFVELQINGSTYTLQPIDYVGETPLENGRYTYQIGANDSDDRFGRLSLTLVND
jgi:hypothetical protein